MQTMLAQFEDYKRSMAEREGNSQAEWSDRIQQLTEELDTVKQNFSDRIKEFSNASARLAANTTLRYPLPLVCAGSECTPCLSSHALVLAVLTSLRP